MRVSVKAYGSGKKAASIHKQAGSIAIKADSEADAKFLAILASIMARQDLLNVLVTLGLGALNNYLDSQDKKTLSVIVEKTARKHDEFMSGRN